VYFLFKLADELASRYCVECKVFCCDACVIDFHASHINQARNKVDEIFKKTKADIEDLKLKTNQLIRQESLLGDDIKNFLEAQFKSITNNIKIKDGSLISLKKRIDEILKLEKDLHTKIAISIEQHINEETGTKLTKMLEESKNSKNSFNQCM
jgi:septal ring factor EnvC (AmiA/AmiB activator)